MATTKKKAVEGDTLVRVLVDGQYGKVDQVVSLTQEQLAQALSSGQVDADPDAVAYAQTLGA